MSTSSFVIDTAVTVKKHCYHMALAREALTLKYVFLCYSPLFTSFVAGCCSLMLGSLWWIERSFERSGALLYSSPIQFFFVGITLLMWCTLCFRALTVGVHWSTPQLPAEDLAKPSFSRKKKGGRERGSNHQSSQGGKSGESEKNSSQLVETPTLMPHRSSVDEIADGLTNIVFGVLRFLLFPSNASIISTQSDLEKMGLISFKSKSTLKNAVCSLHAPCSRMRLGLRLLISPFACLVLRRLSSNEWLGFAFILSLSCFAFSLHCCIRQGI